MDISCRVAWWAASDGGQRLVAQWVDREQKRLQLIAFEGEDATVLIDELQEPWINVSDDARVARRWIVSLVV